MSHLDNWLDTSWPITILIGILGFIAGLMVLTVLLIAFLILVSTSPISAALLASGLVVVTVATITFIYSRNGDSDKATPHERDSLTVLKERYARGEISEDKFEHQVSMLLDVDEIASETHETELVTEQDHRD